PSVSGDEVTVVLGEELEGVDVAVAGEGVAAGVLRESAGTLGITERGSELPPQGWLLRGQTVDHPLPGGGVGRLRNVGIAGREELLLLDLHPFPWRVSDDAGESVRQRVRELQRPVEEAVPFPESAQRGELVR